MGAGSIVLDEYKPDVLLIPATEGKSSEYSKFIKAIDRLDADKIVVKTGDSFSLGAGCNIKVLAADEGEDSNASSIVMRIDYYRNSFLFTGDASAAVLNKIMDSGADITADVLKVAHHGSDYTNPALFLKTVNPHISLISVSRDNQYGHPSDLVTGRLETFGSEIYRTDTNGMITVSGDGKNLVTECNNLINWDAESELKVEDGPIIGNVRSRVYHIVDCLSLPDPKKRIYFASAEDAEEAGYRRCENCLG